jgi:hypothetical protein
MSGCVGKWSLPGQRILLEIAAEEKVRLALSAPSLFVTPDLVQGPFLATRKPVMDARWMLNQVQHDGGG